MRKRSVIVVAVIAAASTACGGTTEPPTEPPPDAGGSPIDLFALFPITDSGPIGVCATCLKNHCRTDLNACANDASCRAGLLCAAAQCALPALLEGEEDLALDLPCVLGCFQGTSGSAQHAFSGLTCIEETCGSACAPPDSEGEDEATGGEGGAPIASSPGGRPRFDAGR